MTETTPRILVVEDEKEIRDLMALHLLRQGYRVKECATAEEAMEEMTSGGDYSLIVLDWMLPGVPGIDFLQQVKRSEHQASVLMVTARTEPHDIVEGLEKGADDYLSKPFEPGVFMARVKALLRRMQLADAKTAPRRVTLAGLTMNFETYDISLNGEKLHLTPSEFKLLAAMIHNRGKVMTRDQLIDQIQGEGINVVGRTIDTHVFGLRKKLGDWSDNIETIRGIGYRVQVEGV